MRWDGLAGAPYLPYSVCRTPIWQWDYAAEVRSTARTRAAAVGKRRWEATNAPAAATTGGEAGEVVAEVVAGGGVDAEEAEEVRAASRGYHATQ